MNFMLAVITYLIMGLVLGAGILMAAKGSFWLLAAGLLVYLVVFSRFGCLPH